MRDTSYVSTHSAAPTVARERGQIDVELLKGAYRAMLRLAHGANLPELREIAYEEDHDSLFRFANAGREVFVTLRDDNYISRALVSVGAYDFDGLEIAARILGRPIELLVDVGANIGSISIPAVARGHAARAIAIEPDRLNFRTLMANIYLNDLHERISARNCALGALAQESLEFQLSPDNKGDHRVRASSAPGAFGEEDWSVVRVPSTSLDTLAKTERALLDPSAALVWVDVQGWEAKVLAGASDVLLAGVPFVIEFWPYGLRRNAMLDALIGQIAVSFRQIHVLNWPGTPSFDATEAGIATILRQLDPLNPLSACDLLLL